MEYPTKTWEVWDSGFCHFAQIGEDIYGAQKKTDDGVICRELGVADENSYNKKGVFLTKRTPRHLYLFTRTHTENLDSISVWGALYALGTATGDITGNYVLFDAGNKKVPFTIQGPGADLLILNPGGGLVLPFVIGGEYPTLSANKMPYDAKSMSIALELSYTKDDPDFRLYNLILPRAVELKHNIT